MEARQLVTVADFLLATLKDERIELINGEIVKRPMARFNHALAQSGLSDEMATFKRRKDGGGWWIVTEISVRYNQHHCPTHDLAGWRKERVPTPPAGVMETLPDWVCEITSPGHEHKDLVTHLIRLQTYQVPYYWIISPENKTLIAYELAGEHYRVVFSKECENSEDCQRVFIPPFQEQGIDLGYIFGMS
ncbi:Uma2 family endonuclease [Thiofilum flexile]|uniref:Uma2 family endonuclease n=1 Tax=Thiofilum flexile TaxID=125627 RepID=UPI00036B1582|nr:Uma2 family endonuclease [Thiofilum flexile]